ncbi:MAG: Lrp/AsnC family transcriptional regulator [Sphingobacteriales bacterium]|nr:MAG: Lrp/AsnC family transcriptional regulator [Sphingobacteriales bacterium]
MDLHKLDTTDIGILNLLQQDAHLGYKEIAHKLKRNKSVIGERIQRLKANGYIKGSVALVDVHKVMSIFLVFTFIELKDHSQDRIQAFKEKMISLPQIMECYHITGRYDFKLKIAVSDMAAYNTLLREQVACLDFVGKIETFTVIDETKMKTGYELK